MYHFIVNPSSCCGRGFRVWMGLEKLLIRDGVEYEVKLTGRQGDAKKFAAELTEGCKDPKVIIVVGGDGTMNEVLDGLSFCSILTVGYIPAGSGNDMARSLKLPRNPKKCLKKILYPKYHKLVDYGVVSYGDDIINYRRFAVSAGVGLDAAVCHNLLHSKLKVALNKFHLGGLVYLLIGCKQLMHAKPVKGYLVIDGIKKVEFNHIYFISAHIHPFEGGGFKFAPGADCTDGKLSVCVVSIQAKYKLIPVLLSAYGGRHSRYKGVRTYEGKEIMIHTECPMPVHVDGESCFCQKDLEIRCIERALRIIV